MNSLVLIIHNVRSTHNVGSMLRTADGLGVSKVYLSGYTPYPQAKNDTRLPHLSQKVNNQIHKTALGAEHSVRWEYSADIFSVINTLKNRGHKIVALEQAANSVDLEDFRPSSKTALIVGREVEGIEKDLLEQADEIIEIPMKGQKESLNVAVAAAIALYHIALKARQK